jgi:hypothetical protein
LCTLAVSREKRKKKKSIIGGNLTIISSQTSHYVEEDTTTHPERWRMARFGHWVVSHAPPEWCRHHPLTGAWRTRARSFSIKKLKTKYENIKTPLMTLLIIQNTQVKNTKIPSKAKFFFFLSFIRLKTFFYCTWKVEKPKTPLFSNPIFFLSWRQISIFTITKLVKSQESFCCVKKFKKKYTLLNNLLITTDSKKKTKKPSMKA